MLLLVFGVHEPVDVGVVDTSGLGEQGWQGGPSGGDVFGALELADETDNGVRSPCNCEEHYTRQSYFGDGQLLVLLKDKNIALDQTLFL